MRLFLASPHTIQRFPKGTETLIQTIGRGIVQEKAKKAGFDWREADGAFDKIAEESKELKKALEAGVQADIEDELGDLLFSVVNTARFCNCEAETALDKATKKFMKRFTITEALANEKGIDMKTASIEALDELWDEAKKKSI